MDKSLVVQVQQNTTESNRNAAQQLFDILRNEGGAKEVALEEDESEGSCNIHLEVANPEDFWAGFARGLSAQHPVLAENLASRWIVVCEGDHGWDDYKTLAHFSGDLD